jgi:ABC-2 type transport system ATP-binding protein
MHLGQIVALDTPERLRAALGDELVELRVEGHGSDALALLRDRGVAGPDAFAVGSTLTVPLANRRAGEAIAAIERLGLGVASLSTRRPSLDDVYLQLTGGRLEEAA